MGALALGTLVIIIGGLLYVKRKSLEFLYNRTYWAIGALVSQNLCTVRRLCRHSKTYLSLFSRRYNV